MNRILETERSYRRFALIGAALLVIGTIAVFVKGGLVAPGYTVRAEVASATQLKTGSEVRIAGLRVGQVRRIAPGPRQDSIVTLAIDPAGRPLHEDAQLVVRPRLLLEGNGYIDLSPGTPGAPELKSGALLGRAQTAVSVQLDQALDVFDLPTRGALQRSIAALAEGLGDGGSRGGRTGAYGLRRAMRGFDAALGSVTQVARAAEGTDRGDLGSAVGSSADSAAQVATDPIALAQLVTNFNRLTGALAAQDTALGASVRGFDAVLAAAPPSLDRLDPALPKLTQLGNALRPTLHTAPETLRTTNRLLAQIKATVRPGELPALVRKLEPVTSRLPQLEERLGVLLGLTTPVTDCVSSNIVPALDLKIEDGPNTTGDPVWLDAMHLFASLASFSSAVDGNGGTVRLGITAGDRNVRQFLPGLGEVVGNAPGANGVSPTWLGYGVEPPYRPDQKCADQEIPDLGARSGSVPAIALPSMNDKARR